MSQSKHIKDKAAQELGKKGGNARAKNLSPEKRKEIAIKAANTRWNNKHDKQRQN